MAHSGPGAGQLDLQRKQENAAGKAADADLFSKPF